MYAAVWWCVQTANATAVFLPLFVTAPNMLFGVPCGFQFNQTFAHPDRCTQSPVPTCAGQRLVEGDRLSLYVSAGWRATRKALVGPVPLSKQLGRHSMPAAGE